MNFLLDAIKRLFSPQTPSPIVVDANAKARQKFKDNLPAFIASATTDNPSSILTLISAYCVALDWAPDSLDKLNLALDSILTDSKCKYELLVEIDGRFRREYHHHRSDFKINPAHFAAATFLSSHENGRVREKAVNVLGASGVMNALPFLLLRSNDWVEPIRKKSLRFAIELICRNPNAAIQKHLASMGHAMLAGKGSTAGDLKHLVATVKEFRSQIAIDLMISLSTAVYRRTLVTAVLDASDLDDDAFHRFALALGEGPDIKLKSLIIRRTSNIELLKRYFGNASPATRQSALIRLIELRPEGLESVVKEAIMDSSSRVRIIAQFEFEKSGRTGLRTFYREALKDCHHRPVALAGLGETGNASDVDIIMPFTHDTAIRVRRMAWRSIRSLKIKVDPELALTHLDDPSPSVSRQVECILAKEFHLLPRSEILEAFASLKFQHARFGIVRCLAAYGTWDVLPILIFVAASVDPELASRAEQTAIHRFGDVFTSPTQTERDAIFAACRKFPDSLLSHWAIKQTNIMS